MRRYATEDSPFSAWIFHLKNCWEQFRSNSIIHCHFRYIIGRTAKLWLFSLFCFPLFPLSSSKNSHMIMCLHPHKHCQEAILEKLTTAHQILRSTLRFCYYLVWWCPLWRFIMCHLSTEIRIKETSECDLFLLFLGKVWKAFTRWQHWK